MTQEAFKVSTVAESNPATSAASTSSSLPQAPAPVGPVPDDATKQEMVQQMSTQSGMNLEWSLKWVLHFRFYFGILQIGSLHLFLIYLLLKIICKPR